MDTQGGFGLEGRVRPTWSRDDPLAYVWTEALPTGWLRLVPDRRATEAMLLMVVEHLDQYDRLVSLAVDYFHEGGAVHLR